jgi:hypothetical protein
MIHYCYFNIQNWNRELEIENADACDLWIRTWDREQWIFNYSYNVCFCWSGKIARRYHLLSIGQWRVPLYQYLRVLGYPMPRVSLQNLLWMYTGTRVAILQVIPSRAYRIWIRTKEGRIRLRGSRLPGLFLLFQLLLYCAWQRFANLLLLMTLYRSKHVAVTMYLFNFL